ncbi:MAG: hypothetical protein MZV63_26145 [Marinilabiliales bacterium]|nr:hypothetical protein [Marinilabiliales bacterium]
MWKTSARSSDARPRPPGWPIPDGPGRLVTAALSNLPAKPVFLKLQGEGLWTCGRESYFDLIEKAGETSVVPGSPRTGSNTGWRPHSRQSDLIVVLAPIGRGVQANQGWLKSQPGLRETACVSTAGS